MIQYADETTLCINADTTVDSEIKPIVELKGIVQHFSNINLKSNISKSNLIKFCRKQAEQNYISTVMMDDDLLVEADSTKLTQD